MERIAVAGNGDDSPGSAEFADESGNDAGGGTNRC
jgi:hypothetical protein